MTVYRSTLPRRTRDVIPDDFRDTPDLTIFETAGSKIDRAALHWWNRHIPLLPRDFFSVFSRNFDVPVSVDMELAYGAIKIMGKNKDGKFEGEREFLFYDLETYRNPQSTLRVAPRYRGQGIGKSWFRMSVEISAILGKGEHSFYAGLEKGADTWAALQIPLDMRACTEPERTKSSIKYLQRLEAIEPHLKFADFVQIKDFCYMAREDDMIKLNERGWIVPETVRETLERPGSRIFQSLKRAHERSAVVGVSAGSEAATEIYNMRAAFTHAAHTQKPVTFSAFLGCNVGWPAIVDFDNARRMEKIGQCTGGWRTIEPS